MVCSGSKAAPTAPKCDFRYTSENGLNSDIAACPNCANSRHHSQCDCGWREFFVCGASTYNWYQTVRSRLRPDRVHLQSFARPRSGWRSGLRSSARTPLETTKFELSLRIGEFTKLFIEPFCYCCDKCSTALRTVSPLPQFSRYAHRDLRETEPRRRTTYINSIGGPSR